MQERSRRAWEKVLEAGEWILVNEGREALTIAAVCDRAGVSPTAIYRRVDGLDGLFWAIYDRVGSRVIATYREKLQLASTTPSGSRERVAGVVRAVAETFEHHRDFLHPIIRSSTGDAELDTRGARESFELVRLVAELLPSPDAPASHDAARMLHQECTFRAMYGDSWLSHEPEQFDSFVARLTRMAQARLLAV